MAKLTLICGLPGAGKTTLAKRLEQETGALRLCPDEWIAAILADRSDVEELDRLRDPVEQIQWQTALAVLARGLDVILEFGFWSRAERSRFRGEAEARGHIVELISLTPDLEELWRRVDARNRRAEPDGFAVSREDLEKAWRSFEPPDADEL